jgi:hypothetical protein
MVLREVVVIRVAVVVVQEVQVQDIAEIPVVMGV